MSSHKCIGNTVINDNFIPELGITCIFENICISSKTIHYFEDEWNKPFVRMNGQEKPLMEAITLRRTRVTRQAPINMIVSKKNNKTRFEKGTFVYLSRSFVTNINLGHLIWEEFFPLFHTILQLNIEYPRVLRDITCSMLKTSLKKKM